MVNFFTNYESQCCMAEVKQLQQPFQNQKMPKTTKNKKISKDYNIFNIVQKVEKS